MESIELGDKIFVSYKKYLTKYKLEKVFVLIQVSITNVKSSNFFMYISDY